MSEIEVRTGYRERPLFFEAGGDVLFGIVTDPAEERGRTAVVILPGGGTPLTTNTNRVSVTLCRELASLGYTAFRMDYHGTGESSGSVEQFHLGRPFVEDVTAAVDLLRERGAEKVVLIGSTCFGSRTALATAAVLEDVVEVVVLATPLRDFAMGERHSTNAATRRSFGRYLVEALRPRTIRGLFDRRSRRLYLRHARAKVRVTAGRLTRLMPWRRGQAHPGQVSRGLVDALDRLVERGTPILFVYGSEEDYYKEFVAAGSLELAGTLARAGSSIRVVTVPGRVHGLPNVEVQNAVIDLILGWAKERIRESGRDAARVGV